jgi:hypothetical protein
MNIVYLCYETDPKTGLSAVKEVTQIIGFAVEWLSLKNSTIRRVEKWIIDGHENGSGMIEEYHSMPNFGGDELDES